MSRILDNVWLLRSSTTGRTLAEAYALAEEIENLARQYLLARTLGPTHDLPADEMARVLEKFKHYGQQRKPDAG